MNYSDSQMQHEQAVRQADLKVTIQRDNEFNLKGISNYFNITGNIQNVGDAAGQLYNYSLYVDNGKNKVYSLNSTIVPTFDFFLQQGETKSFTLLAQFEQLPQPIGIPYPEMHLSVRYSDGELQPFDDIICYLVLDNYGTVIGINPGE